MRQEGTPFHTRLNVPRQQQVPAFVITSIDHRWKEQSLQGVDPKEKKIPVLIASNPGYGRSHYQYEHQIETTPNPAAADADYDVTEDEANDPRFKYLYDTLSKQYIAKYEAAAANATDNTATEQTTQAPDPSTTTEASSTPASPVTQAPTSTTTPASKEELLQSYPSYQSVSSVSSHNDDYQPPPRPISLYQPVRAHRGRRPSKYVPSDVFTIEQSTNYRPRHFHSDAIFYQKALAFLRDYKESVLNNRQHGLTYRPNSETDDPAHVANAYDELTPVLVKDREIPLVPRQYLRPVPLPAPEVVEKPALTYDEHPVAGDEDKQLVGFLPVIALPKKNRYPPTRSYTLLSQLAGSESADSVKAVPKRRHAPKSSAESSSVEAAQSRPSISFVRPQQYEHHVPFLRVVTKPYIS